MRFTAELPIGVIEPDGEFQSAPAVFEMTRALEHAHIDACFVTDHPAPDSEWRETVGHDALDPFAALAFVAAASERLMLHTNIVVLPYRNPFVTAKAAATIQVLSGGRLILGVGVGYQKAEFAALGVDFRHRGMLSDEAIGAIRTIWRDAITIMQGADFEAVGNAAWPKPKPLPPIWIGGASPRAIERAARLGDGWCPFHANPGMGAADADSGIHSMHHLRTLISQIAKHRDAVGISGTFDVVLGPRMRIKEATRTTCDRFVGLIWELKAAGVTWATINIAHPSRAAYVELVQWLGEEVLPHCR